MRVVLVTILVVAVAVGAGLAYLVGRAEFRQAAAVFLAEQLDGPADDDPRVVRFVVRPGESSSAIAANLESAGLVRSAWSFRLLARLRGVEEQLRAGQYALRANMTAGEILEVLQAGRTVAPLVFPEGWRAVEMADALAANGVARREEFLALVGGADGGDFRADFLANRPPGASLEGYLFPDSYELLPDTPARDVVEAMLANFGRRFTPELRARAAQRSLTIHEVVTLASIVEREAAVPAERPLIAGVYLNRLQRGMRLQADPTVQFAVAGLAPPPRPGGYWKRGLTELDLGLDSPYNTYRYAGLPPGPVANPGLASLRAVLEPATSDYLYFVAKPDGSHAFARTLREHNENVARYQGAGG